MNLENPSHPHVQEGGEECPPAGSTGVRGAHVWGEECEYQPSTITSPSTSSPLINKWDSRSGWNSVYSKWGCRKTIQQGFLVFKLRVEMISTASSYQHCTFCGILWVYLWFQFKPIIDRKGLFKEILCYTLTPASSSNLCVWSGNNDDLDLRCKTLTQQLKNLEINSNIFDKYWKGLPMILQTNGQDRMWSSCPPYSTVSNFLHKNQADGNLLGAKSQQWPHHMMFYED